MALRWSDLLVAADGSTSLSLARSIALSSDGMVEKDTKTHQSRKVVLDAGTVEILAAHRRQQEEPERQAEELCPVADVVDGVDGDEDDREEGDREQTPDQGPLLLPDRAASPG